MLAGSVRVLEIETLNSSPDKNVQGGPKCRPPPKSKPALYAGLAVLHRNSVTKDGSPRIRQELKARARFSLEETTGGMRDAEFVGLFRTTAAVPQAGGRNQR